MGWWSMSSKTSFLALQLEGPLQSWGFDSQYNRRNTGLMPTKSGIAGMCCAALGLPRGSSKEREFLTMFATVQMTAIAIREKQPKRNCRFNGCKTTIPYKTQNGQADQSTRLRAYPSPVPHRCIFCVLLDGTNNYSKDSRCSG